jgi:hypothetical protein
MKELLKIFLSSFIIILFLSCSVSAPVIKQQEWKILFIKDLEKDIIYESLQVFIHCYDEDGENDIETLYFISDESGIYWEINSENWEEKIIDKVKWIGSSSFVMPDRSPIPRNTFRVHVRDLAGETVEDKIHISKRIVDTKELKFPELKINDNNYFLKKYEIGTIYIYSGDEKLASGSITDKQQSFKDIFGNELSDYSDDIEFYISVEDGDLNLKSGPWY